MERNSPGFSPSTVATGAYSVTVTYNSATSSGFAVTVVASQPGIFTQDESGYGLAAVENVVSATELDLRPPHHRDFARLDDLTRPPRRDHRDLGDGNG